VWLRADAIFKASSAEEDGEGGRWRKSTAVPETWPMRVLDITMLCRLTSFRHLGIFPEQLPHWEWMIDWLQGVRERPARVLNLFAYTGAASLLAAKAGAEVTHVDASRKAIAWARQNQAASRLGEAPIRWILDDARKFVAREVRRGNRYHCILIDPPKFGRGPDGELWDVFAHLAPLLRDCSALLAARAALVLTTYAIRASALATDGLVRDCLAGRPGRVESGELAVVEEAAGRLLPTSLFTRWTSDEAAS
jgi:23S rRNA (cytosine1962-C5)-methyltransferase